MEKAIYQRRTPKTPESNPKRSGGNATLANKIPREYIRKYNIYIQQSIYIYEYKCIYISISIKDTIWYSVYNEQHAFNTSYQIYIYMKYVISMNAIFAQRQLRHMERANRKQYTKYTIYIIYIMYTRIMHIIAIKYIIYIIYMVYIIYIIYITHIRYI